MHTTMQYRGELENHRRELNARLDHVHQNHSLNRNCRDVERGIRERIKVTANALFYCGLCPDGRCGSCTFKSEVRTLLRQ